MPSFEQSAEFKALKHHRAGLAADLKGLFARRGVKTPHLYYDFSRQLVDETAVTLLLRLAEASGLRNKIKAMFNGEKINATEARAVLHVALRDPDRYPEVKEVLAKVKAFAAQNKFNNIVAIGIGGSYLGPEYLAEACAPFALPGKKLVFVANVDGTDFARKTAGLDPKETLVIVISKTFTTAETMKNAETAKAWLQERLGSDPAVVKEHMIAVSTAEAKVKAFGIDPANMFGFWDWVGGRYSATSAVGAVPLALYLGYDNFEQILKGAYWLDQHYLHAAFEENIPVLSALLDIWNINLMGYGTRALLPYSQGLGKLPAHTQQVEMESNGKLVDLEGKPVRFATGEVVFGEPGTNGQHSFYQLLHQGTQIIPADFIGFIKPQYPLGAATAESVTHHEELMTNFFAQPDALAFGKKDEYLPKNFPGNRPSSSLLLKELTPFTAGLLLAWTEHRAATKGFIWGINSFDQFGVELGKKLGVEHRNRIMEYHATGKLDQTGLNQSTAELLQAFLNGKLPN
ncbi:MAG: glucose-6-phosphate isomerase [Candidatus Margulisbacteria bacterium]|jgi:glucose-6-phosphate isomerase|nr:glucose-6-phosphate isomerase [Candidatus Margulisiibacteriota bacterium]